MNPVVESQDTPRTDGLTDRRALLAEALRRKARQHTVLCPLSHGQKALWFLHRSAPDSCAYHVSFSARIRSVLDIQALRRACQALVDRHAALRAVFHLRDGEPVQEIAGDREVLFRVSDCFGRNGNELHDRVQAAYREPFDLERQPPFRVDLFRCDAQEHVLLITVHHIAYDAWSLWLNLDELGQLYAAEIAGRAPALPVLECSYRDHINRQAQMLAGPEGQKLWRFWQSELAGELPTLVLNTDRPRPAVQTYAGASLRFAMGPSRSARVRKLAQSCGVTPFVLLLAAFQVLLHRYSGQDEIIVGSPTTGRGDPQMAAVAGYFVNPVVLRANLADNPAFNDFLERVAHTAISAMQHQDFPFPLLVERLQPRRDPAFAPLFQVSFVYQKPQRSSGAIDWLGWTSQPGSRVCWGGLEIEFFDLPQQEGQFDLELEVLDAGEELHASFKYNTDLFDVQSLMRMESCLLALLDGICDDPARPVRQLPLMPADAMAALGNLLPRVPSRPGDARCLHRIFEEQVLATPDAVAITDGDRQVTYGELNVHANRLAHYLIGQGVGPGTRVGLCLERSWRMLAAMLATVKAGGAYVPIAPEAPQERNVFILQDSQATILLTESAVGTALAQGCAQVLYLDRESEQLAGQSSINPDLDITVEDLLYVIYTSGSTGKPKGALVTHFNVARLFTATDAWFRFDGNDVWTVFHSFAFDFSVWEIWGALLHGGRMVIVPYLVSRAPEEFVALMNAQGVTVLNQTPSAFRQFMEAEQRVPLIAGSPLRCVVFGGEALDLRMLSAWYARHDEAHPRLVNMYGITETTVHVTYRPLGRADVDSGRSVIGEPIPDLHVHVFDEALQPVPEGVPGEMFVAGDGLCRGYLDRPELTAQRFLTRRRSDGGQMRLYRTGDLARRMPGGDIEYLGRVDDQVKIRGFRIELGEIEAALSSHPEVAACVVVVREDDGDKRLVGYVVGPASASSAPSTPGLRDHLMSRLPEYMVPTAFVALDRLPLNSNGKIDRRALPAPVLERDVRDGGFVPPRDAIEHRIQAHWEAVLKVHPVSVRDNFFEIGGHSLLAVNLITRLEQEFGLSMPMATLFRRPTIEQLGQLLRDNPDTAGSSLLVPIQPQGEGRPFFCVAGGGGSVAYYYPLAQQMGSARPFFGLQAVGLDGDCEPLTSVEALAQAHLAAIRSVQPRGPYLLGGHCFGGSVAFEIAQCLRREGEEVERLVLIDVPSRYLEGMDTAQPDDAAWIARLAAIVRESSGTDLQLTQELLRPLDPADQLALLNERMQAAGFMPPGADVAKVRGLLRVFVANSLARYSPRDVLPVPIALFRAGEHHPDYDFTPADDPGRSIAHSTLGWQAMSSQPVAVHVVPGNHITMLSPQHAAALAQGVAEALAGPSGSGKGVPRPVLLGEPTQDEWISLVPDARERQERAARMEG
ncbi:non-ribosomal peptide synthetase [Agrilutibacter solisilvae]|uniref:Amino acid adenylation domain-containing protein n=1 Tax=Agrilutibacter solisilvae TaxID=2763317 RepID=A0A974XXT9_9GAMM|nr:non-ribosomal peptide synthetase [Lysobacter solisilvae]QSX77638.1 amino acid adenylation domain-containing protein [Lysobacter solisilvae]